MAKESKATKKHADLPAWYHRIKKKCAEHDPEWDSGDGFELCDFDEDISELEEEEDEEPFQCHCEAAEDPKVECECYLEYDPDDDNVSEISYVGPDANEYYRLKDLREERKEELREQREAEDGRKQTTLELHKRHVEVVKATYKALKKDSKQQNADSPPIDLFENSSWDTICETSKGGKSVPIDRYRATTFNLYSVDYVEHCYQYDVDLYWKYIEFMEYNEGYYEGHNRKRKLESSTSFSTGKKEKTVESRIYVNPDYDMQFKKIRAPEWASLKRYRLKAEDRNEAIKIQFVGQDYLRMFVSRDIVKAHAYDPDYPVPDSAPEVFEFVGIVPELHKKTAKRLAEMEEANEAHKNKKVRR
ncbi:hypothetical protein M434DRAFT_27159 [Hypoxylon sp. CO27-5]|nr:hypothetical protein M434DRAFT_27159 [Hypoxylon sp. CO27-5]